MTELQYDIKQLEKQRDHITLCIKEGNWEGYSQSLSVRKKRLKDTISKINSLNINLN